MNSFLELNLVYILGKRNLYITICYNQLSKKGNYYLLA